MFCLHVLKSCRLVGLAPSFGLRVRLIAGQTPMPPIWAHVVNGSARNYNDVGGRLGSHETTEWAAG